MRLLLFFFILFTDLAAYAQVTSFNQAGSLPSTNPAFIANLGKDQVSLIARNQWPGYQLGSFTSEFSFNKFFERINSSVGVISNYTADKKGNINSISEGIQYGYRIVFLERAYLCAGIGITHHSTEVDLNNFHYLYEPKKTYFELPSNKIKNESISTSYGIFLHDFMENQYIGFSVKDQQVMQVSNSTNGELKTAPTFSIQGMKGIPYTREALLISIFEIEKTGRSVYTIKDSGTTVLSPSNYYFFFQENIYFRKVGMFGIGYKYFTKNYGCFNARINFSDFEKLPILLGFSFDTKPYIQNDRIKTNSSFEFYLKYSFYQGRY